MSFLELKDVHKAYQLADKTKFPVLKGINLSFERGEFVSILGESGGGKTTLMNIIGGLDHQYTGDVLVNGKSTRTMSEKELDNYRRQTIGFVFQNFNLISHLSILDNVMVSLEMTKLTHKEQVQTATDLLKRVGLGEHIKKYPNQLSGGQKQRVAIARALASDPDIIIADEPTGALDSGNSHEIMDLLNGIATDGKLVICVTHSQEVANYGTRIVHMVDGLIDQDQHLKDAFPVKGAKASTVTHHLSFRANFNMAMKHMRYNLKRNVLIVFGGAIGILSVLLMLSLGRGVQGYMNHEISGQINPQSIQVTQKTKSTDPNSVKMTQADYTKMTKMANVSSVERGFFAQGAQVQYAGKTDSISLFQTYNKTILDKSLSIGHQPTGLNEVTITKDLAQKYDKADYKKMVGKKITFFVNTYDAQKKPIVLSRQVTVSGITTGQSGATVSYNTLQAMFKEKSLTLKPNFLTVNVKGLTNVKPIQDKIKADKYQITGAGAILDTVNTYVKLAFYVLAGIAGISLLVSAIMIIVVLYISVSERTKEIGILRALGVRKTDIRTLFFAESFLIGLFSSIIGVIVVWLAQLGINHATESFIHYNIIQLTPGYIAFGIIVSVVISILAAIAPAGNAAKLDPVEALSHD
ncbi:ABC transporter ATP-binding protein/permease [Loigolactobacillus iwatensis]|uniref:ABC transporter ATP-binding protein/permease n=1 Tax=Loigolactobacillus iwatensis TaxID=1267156 RepID=UPI000F7F72A7|nr:ABC transporter ATP-binding protein/permease [Loigolactobacillus iwatensis]